MKSDTRTRETPTEFRRNMLEVYGESHWEVMRNFILNGSDPVEQPDQDDDGDQDEEDFEEGDPNYEDYDDDDSPYLSDDQLAEADMNCKMIDSYLGDAKSIEAL